MESTLVAQVLSNQVELSMIEHPPPPDKIKLLRQQCYLLREFNCVKNPEARAQTVLSPHLAQIQHESVLFPRVQQTHKFTDWL